MLPPDELQAAQDALAEADDWALPPEVERLKAQAQADRERVSRLVWEMLDQHPGAIAEMVRGVEGTGLEQARMMPPEVALTASELMLYRAGQRSVWLWLKGLADDHEAHVRGDDDAT